MTLRDFLKANKALIAFKKLYHERSKTKITYRQIEADLLTAGEDFIKKALNLNEGRCSYWVNLNNKWNSCCAAHKIDGTKNQSSCVDKTLGSWLKANKIYEKFKENYMDQHKFGDLDYVLKSTNPAIIDNSLYWNGTKEGFSFWSDKHNAWQKFCNNNK